MAIINAVTNIGENAMETVNDGQPNELSKVSVIWKESRYIQVVAVIDSFNASKGPEIILAGWVEQVTVI